jgi:beta-xylosidase
MIFRLKGVDKWFASYQGSSNSYDFPDRFHIAMSDDLIHWTKVKNDKPLYTRGSLGEWDQGGIWFCEIIEHQGMLYMYYEGWGRVGYVENRDQPYFPGRSCIGAASVSKEEFLKWCGIK